MNAPVSVPMTFPARVLLATLLVSAVSACAPKGLSDTQLLRWMVEFEQRIEGSGTREVRRSLWRFGRALAGRRLHVDSAMVAAPYERQTRPGSILERTTIRTTTSPWVNWIRYSIRPCGVTASGSRP